VATARLRRRADTLTACPDGILRVQLRGHLPMNTALNALHAALPCRLSPERSLVHIQSRRLDVLVAIGISTEKG